MILLGRKAALLLDRIHRALARIEGRVWRVETAIGTQIRETRKLQKLIEHLVADPAKVRELADQIERTNDALEEATEENKPQEE